MNRTQSVIKRSTLWLSTLQFSRSF